MYPPQAGPSKHQQAAEHDKEDEAEVKDDDKVRKKTSKHGRSKGEDGKQ